MSTASDYSMIIFFLIIAQLTPENGKNITLSSPSQRENLSVQYIKAQKAWQIKENNKGVFFSLDKKKENLSLDLDGVKQTVAIKDVLKADKKINWNKANSIEVNAKIGGENPQTPILLKRSNKTATFSQEKGFLADLREITIRWE